MRDVLRFLGWFAFFSALLSLRSVALSPDAETSYDSGSVYNREEPVSAASAPEISTATGSATVAPEESVPVAPPASSSGAAASDTPEETVSVYVRPDGSIVKRALAETLRLNYDSDRFRPKIVPMSLVYDADRTEPRGQVSGKTLTLSLNIPTTDETIAVLVHEMGHIVDIQHLRKGMLSADPSKEFYALSWQSSSEKLPDAKISDFVSGYALSNQYEDFAETFAFYVLHNDTFRKRAASEATLRAKYEFMRDEVFDDGSFEGTDFGSGTVADYFWDTTKLAFDRKKYLFFIR
jgi:hypothetical protein